MTCIHRWLIAPPRGPVSKARCKHCGAKREFKNAFLKDTPVPLRSRMVHTAKLRAGS